MFKYVIILILLFSKNSIFAQKKLPEFGIFSQEEIDLKVCSFDKEAEAVKLIDNAITYQFGERCEITRRIRIKILKETGKSFGDVSILFYKNDESEIIKDIKGIVYNPSDGSLLKLEKKNIYEKKRNELYSEMVFALPNVQVGSIIEYSYLSDAKVYISLNPWYFQTNIPTVFSGYFLTIPSRAEFSYVASIHPEYNVNVIPNNSEGTVYFEMENIPALRDEAFMDSEKDNLNYVNFQLAGYLNQFGSKQKSIITWTDMNRELLYDENFGRQIEKNIPAANDIISSLKLISSPVERLKTAYNFIRENISWTGFTSIYSSDGLKKVFSSKKGTNSEINLLLINILKEVGIECYPLLCSKRSHGKVNVKTPFLDQFNLTAAFAIIENEPYILDATEKTNPYNLIPPDLLNTVGFLISKKKSNHILIFDEINSYTNHITLKGALNNNGLLKGEALIKSFNYAKSSRIKSFKMNKSNLTNIILSGNKDVTIDSLKVENINEDTTALLQTFDFSKNTTNGDYSLLDLNWFTGIGKNPFLGEHRFSDVNLGSTYKYFINFDFEIDKSFIVENIPMNANSFMYDTSMSFVRKLKFENNHITGTVQIYYNKSFYQNREYPDLKAYYKTLYSLLTDKIVLKKK